MIDTIINFHMCAIQEQIEFGGVLMFSKLGVFTVLE